MHWILQNNLFNEAAYQVLLDTLLRFDLSHTIHKVVPFIGELEPSFSGITKNICCMGSYSLRHIAKKEGWYPGVFDLESCDFNVQLKHWGTNMLNHDALVIPFGEAYFTSPSMFIRPIQDSKVFAGKVFDRNWFTEWQHRVCDLRKDDGSSLTYDTLIQVCRLKEIYTEARYWIVRGEIVTSSIYKIGNTVLYTPCNDIRYREFVQSMISIWQPHDAFVIDIADTPDGLKIIEINTLNSSGFYAADLQKLVMALENNFNEE